VDLLKISEVSLLESESYNTLSAKCGGFPVYYRFPASMDLPVSADPFVAASLLPAMHRQTNIRIDDDVPVSPELLGNLDRLQGIFSLWEEQLGKRLHRVSILGGNRTTPRVPPDNGVIAFFSGGVDGTYTFLRNEQRIDWLLFAKGIDMQLSNDALYTEAFERNSNYLAARGKRLVPCETNVRFLGHEHGLGWGLCFGGGLSSIALAAGARTCFLASGVTYAMTVQEGSNYITDALWSSDHTRIVHDGAEAERLEKIARLAEDPGALEILRVCWHDQGYNCGTCEKCLRTMIGLRLLGLSTPNFPELTDDMIRKKVARLRVHSPHTFVFVEENLKKAEEVGDRVLAQALRRVWRNYEVRGSLRRLRNALRR
jgi:hypothetical protein